MSTIDKEDWIHVDSYWTEVEQFEAKIEDLQAALKSAEEDEVYFLSQLIEMRWRYSDYEDICDELGHLVKLYRKPTIEKAIELLNKEYPSRTKESWGL